MLIYINKSISKMCKEQQKNENSYKMRDTMINSTSSEKKFLF